MENCQVVLLEAEMLKATKQRIDVAEKVGEDNDQRAPPHLLGQVMQSGDQSRLAVRLRFGFVQRCQKRLQVGWVSARRNVEDGALVDAEQTRRVPLVNDEVSQRGQQA